jgi:hypothetical protein
MRSFLLGLLMVVGSHCLANDLQHRRLLLNELKRNTFAAAKVDFPFVSHFSVRREDGLFLRNTGETAFSAPSQAISAYDTSVVHELSDFYRAKGARTAFILNQHLGTSGYLLSLGYDSGSKSEKFQVARSLYMGMAKSIKLSQGSTLYFSAGRWLGGEVSESPCIDAYQREYWCPNLTSWQDRPGLKNRREANVDLVWQLTF